MATASNKKSPEKPAAELTPSDGEVEAVEATENPVNGEQNSSTEALADTTAEAPADTTAEAPADATTEAAQAAPAETPEESVAADSTENDSASPAEKETEAKEAKPKPAVEIKVAEELPKLVAELESVSDKNTTKLVTIDNLINRYRKLIPADEVELLKQATAIRESLDQKFKENAGHQEQLKTATLELLEKLEQSLQEGQSVDALPTWDRIQGNISNTNGEIRQGLQEKANPFKPRIAELRDWKIFAATEKKKELIQQMEHLGESKMHAADKSKHITRLHKEWKVLGRSNQNEELWQQFKQFSDKAYEPCADYFKERKQTMAANLKARRDLCDSLEADIKALDEKEPKVSLYNKLIKDAEDTWKKHAPVEQSKIRPLQKRFYNSINVLRKKRKSILKTNAAGKRALIEQANALIELEDRSEAMQEAKRLQKEWKEIGPTSYKEDKDYWDSFRQACDKIFESRGSEKGQRKPRNQESDTDIQDKLSALEKVLQLSEEELRQSRNYYQDLAQSFSSALDSLDKRRRGKFLDKFNGLKRKIDNRFKALPDKKSLALQAQLNEAVDYLLGIESALIETCDSDFGKAKEKFSNDDWQAIDKGKEETLLTLLESRSKAIQESNAVTDYEKHIESAVNTARELCIQSEIRAGSESPDCDQAMRMQLQLGQLQKGLGQARHTSKENLQFSQQARLQLLCLGPIPQEQREGFKQRLEESSKRLL